MLKTLLIGNLGADAELRYSPDGRPFLRVSVASNYRARSPEGEWTDATEWVRCTLFGAQADDDAAIGQAAAPERVARAMMRERRN